MLNTYLQCLLLATQLQKSISKAISNDDGRHQIHQHATEDQEVRNAILVLNDIRAGLTNYWSRASFTKSRYG